MKTFILASYNEVFTGTAEPVQYGQTRIALCDNTSTDRTEAVRVDRETATAVLTRLNRKARGAERFLAFPA